MTQPATASSAMIPESPRRASDGVCAQDGGHASNRARIDLRYGHAIRHTLLDRTRGGGIVDGRPIDALGKILFGFVWSLARYPVPTLGAILVAAPVLNFGRALGLPLLFWHGDAPACARGGAAVTGGCATLALRGHRTAF